MAGRAAWKASVWRFRDKHLEEPLQCRIDVWAEARNRSLAMSHQGLDKRGTAVRGLALKQEIERAPQAVKVATDIGKVSAVGLFGGHVIDGAENPAGTRERTGALLGHRTRQTNVQ